MRPVSPLAESAPNWPQARTRKGRAFGRMSLQFVVKREIREMGRTRWIFDCPACGVEVVGFLWSLAGRGKRCVCGALHTMTGTTPPTPGVRPSKAGCFQKT